LQVDPTLPQRLTPTFRRPASLPTLFLLGALASAAPGQAQTVGNPWQPIGPRPIVGGGVENQPPLNPAVGAVHTIAAHPTNANILYIGAVNGGLWKSTNATAVNPSWTRLIDSGPSLSIGALELDPTDATGNTLVAAIGNVSSFGEAGPLTGLLRTTNGGTTWTQINGGGVLFNKSIWGVAARGTTLVAAVRAASPLTGATIGIFRSTNGGASFTQISNGNGSATGLPGGFVFDLVGEPGNNARLYTGVTSATSFGGANGIYRSTNTGANWTKISNAAIDALIVTGATNNIELAVSKKTDPATGQKPLFVAIVNNGRLAGVFRTANGGTTWQALGVPSTTEAGGANGLHPGGQGFIHLSIAADPVNDKIVYLGGDRQPDNTEPAGVNVPQFPNGLGAQVYAGRLFRADASRPAGSQWQHLTHSRFLGTPGGGTASSSAPHADSREIVFDAAGVLLQSDDGGIYKRTSPRSNTGDWFSLNGNLQTTELHSLSWDETSGIAFGGAQDNDTSYQLSSGNFQWQVWIGGDGGDTEVDDSNAFESTRLTSAQFLGNFNRAYWDFTNTNQGFDFAALTVVGGGDPIVPQFYTPLRLNEAQPNRLVLGGDNSVYESADQGDTLVEVGPGIVANGSGDDPFAFGGFDNPHILYVAAGDSVFVRTAAFPAPLLASTSFPGAGSGSVVHGVALDPKLSTSAFAINDTRVYRTANAGGSWTDVTGNLTGLNPGILRSLAFAPTAFGNALVVGTLYGTFVAIEDDGYAVWYRLGTGLPSAQIYELSYDAFFDELYAATLGRGAFVSYGVLDAVADIQFGSFQPAKDALSGTEGK
jgi:hypothetical protein